jgi:sulfur-oxidizing protein SoxX
MIGARILLAAMALAALGNAALAGDVAPADVKFVEMAVAEPLTATPGDPEEGAKVFKDRGLGNCLACHANRGMEKELFHGTVGPAVDGAGSRWEPAQLRAIVANSKAVFGSETVMPGFYSLEVGQKVDEEHAGKTILTAQQVEDVVAYLATLKQ